MTESFMVAWYGQAGPPSITQLRIIDLSNDAIIYDAEWDITPDGERELYSHYFDEVLADRDYALVVRFDKPMRYRNSSGEVAVLQGQSTATNPLIQATSGGENVDLNFSNQRWVNQKNSHWESYGHYQDDTFVVDFNIDSGINAADDAELTWKITTADMVGQSIDADPSTVVTWANGQWQNYEDSDGELSINGGFDTTISINVSNDNNGLRIITPYTGLYFDPSRSGEGFNIEVLSSDTFLLQWYTFDEDGNPKWLIGSDNLMATNAFKSTDILTAQGGVFGPEFDPDAIQLIPSGDVELIFNAPETIFGPLDEPTLRFRGKMKYTYPDGRKFRTELDAVAGAAGIGSVSDLPPVQPPIAELTAASIIGSWIDLNRNGEGFHIQETTSGNAVILWYSYGPNGGQEWFIGSGGFVTETDDNVNINFSEVYQVRGGTFGDGFNAENIELIFWGEIELDLQCTSGTFSFIAEDPAYGTGTYQVAPITRPASYTDVCSE